MRKLFKKFKTGVKLIAQRVFITMQLYGENGLANHSAAGAYGFLLSVAPMFLLIAFFILAAFQSAPHAVAVLFSNISFLDIIIDEQWLEENFITAARPSVSGIISVLCIFWAGRILALSMQRGLKIIFTGTRTRNFIKDTLITLVLEIAVLLFVLMLIFGSQPALFFYRTFDFIPNLSEVLFPILNKINFVYPIIMLWLISFFAYLFTPVNPPKKLSALQGALFCAISYGFTSIFLGFLINRANYNFLYGTLGNVIFMLVNVYFFFIFFFTGAQFAFVIDSFEALQFTMLRKSRTRAMENNSNAKTAGRLDLISKIFFQPEGRIKKYLHKYKKGVTIFSQGDSGADIYYLLEGEVEVTIHLSNNTGDSAVSGGESTLTIYKPGVIFGEMGYLLSETRSATTIAKTDVSVIVLPPSEFEKVLTHDTTLDRELIENITRRLKSTNQRLAETL